jgi:uncharacterized protein (DUF488 family)
MSTPSDAKEGTPSARQVVWTVGHSTRTAGQFVEVLAAYDIELVVDVRRFAGSRRMPQFGAASLEALLAESGILYHAIPELGGRRRPDPASRNVGWRHPAFRAYADHVASEEFADGLDQLLAAAGGLRAAVMCAELLWWRCHRRIIADVLTSLGIHVVHIRDAHHASSHELAPPARLQDGVLRYDGE